MLEDIDHIRSQKNHQDVTNIISSNIFDWTLLKISKKNAEKNPDRGETIHQQYLQRNLHSAFLCWFIFFSFASISNEHPETDFRCLLMAVIPNLCGGLSSPSE
jgi:hypothetical protein